MMWESYSSAVLNECLTDLFMWGWKKMIKLWQSVVLEDNDIIAARFSHIKDDDISLISVFIRE